MEGLKVGRVWSQKFNNIQVKRDIFCFPLRSLAKWQNPFVCSLCWNNRTYGFWPLIANSHEISQCISLADQGKYIIIIYFGVSRWLMVNVGEMYCWRFEGACWNSPEDGGSVFLRNFSKRPEFHGLSTPQNMPMWQQMKFFLVYSKALSASPRGGIGGKVTGEWWIWKSLEANCRSITEVHASLFYALFALMFLTGYYAILFYALFAWKPLTVLHY